MAASDDKPARDRMSALRNGGDEFASAYQSLRTELERYARKLAGRRAEQSEFQPESIVAGALARGMDAALAHCKDDGHFAGWLRRAVKHELLDRVDRKRPGQFALDGKEGPRDPNAGPATAIMRADAASAGRAALLRLLERLGALDMSKQDRALIDLYVIERLPWNEIAARLDMTVGAARVAMKRLRDRLLPAIFAPLRARLTAEEWLVVDAAFVRRIAIERAAAELRRPAREIRRSAIDSIIPTIITEWGGESAELILRLTGHGR